MQECRIDKSEIGLSSEGKSPCELCLLIDSLRETFYEVSKEVKQLEAVKTYERIKKEFNNLQSLHIKCDGCGLCFGGNHIAKNVKAYPGLGRVCQWCQQQIEAIGLSTFKERMKGYK